MNKNKIKDWPSSDRPREKLLTIGPECLSNSELLAILLRTGTRGITSIDLGRCVLRRFKSLRGLSRATVMELRALKGMGDAKIAQIQAALELGKRFREERMTDTSFAVSSAEDIINLIKHRYRDLVKEYFVIILLDAKNHVIKMSIVEEGTVHYAHPIIREILHAALIHNCVSFLCVHNHPSGNCTPSREDRAFTRALKQSADSLDIILLDHIIVAGDSYYSFADHNILS